MIRENSAEKSAWAAQLENAMAQEGLRGGTDPLTPESELQAAEEETPEAPDPGVAGFFRSAVEAVGRGAGRAVNELSNTAFSAGKAAYRHTGLYKLGRDGEEEAEFLDWYEKKTKETNPFQITLGERAEGALGFLETATQFGVGMLGVGKFLKPLKLASRASKAAKAAGVGAKAGELGKVAQTATSGLITDMTAFDPYEQRLSNMIEQGPESIRNPITAYLASDEDDSELENRVRAGLEGLMTGVAVSGVLRGLKALKIQRLWKAGKMSEEDALAQANKALSEDLPEVPKGSAEVAEPEKGVFTVKIKGSETGDFMAFPDRGTAESTASSINTALKIADLPTDELTEDQTKAIFTIQKRIMENPDGMDVEGMVEGLTMNFPRWQAPDEVRALINAMVEAVPEPGKSMRNRSAEGLGKSIPEVYKGALQRTFVAAESPAQAREMAEEFFQSTENLDEKVVALHDYLAARGKEVMNLSEHADLVPDNPKAMENLVEATQDYLRTLWSVNAGSSNIGRALNAHKYRTAGELREAVERSMDDAIADPVGGDVQLNEFLEGFTPNDLVDMARQIRLSEGDPEGILGTMRGLRAKVKNRKNPDPTFWDRLLGFRTEMMLSGPTTQGVNFFNNALVAFQVPAETWWAGVRSGNSRLRAEGTDQMMGAFMYMRDAARAAKKAWKVGDNVLDPNHRIDEFAHLSRHPGGGMLHSVLKAPTRLLLTADEFFKQMTYRSNMRARSLSLARDQADQMGLEGAERNKFLSTRVVKDMRAAFDPEGRGINAKALQMARYTTHSESLEYGVGKWVQEGAAKHPLMRVVFPFVRTPVQIFRFTWERTPMLNRLNRRHAEMLAAGGEQAAIAKARADTGMMMYSMGAMLVAGGMITGSGPKNGRMKEQWLNAGNQPYSIRVGDKQISYRRLEPLATPLGIVADFVQAVGDLDEDDATNMVSASVAALMSSVSSKTFLIGMTDFFDAASSGDAWKVDRMMSSLATSFMPNAANQLNMDPVFRETRGLLDEIYARTPGWSDSLEPRRNLFGEQVLRAPGVFGSRMNPFTVMDAPKDGNVMEELMELGQSISMPGESIEGGRINLASRTDFDNGTGQSPYDRMLELVGDREAMGGTTLRERMEQLVASDRWDSFSVGSDEFPGGRRLDAAKRIVRDYRAKALRQLRREYPLLDAEIRAVRRDKVAAMRGTATPEGAGSGNVFGSL